MNFKEALKRILALNFKKVLKRILALTVLILIVASFFIIPYLLTRSILAPILFFAMTIVGFTISEMSVKTAQRLGERTRRASLEELRREDDVLLQAVAFSQSVFFIYLNLIPGSDFVNVFKILVPIFTVLFYGLRGWGKITNNAKYRYWSIWLFFFIVLTTLLFFTFLLSASIIGYENFKVWGYIFILPYDGVFFGLMRIIKEIFKKRYGYQ